jgi:hypothetical protein
VTSKSRECNVRNWDKCPIDNLPSSPFLVAKFGGVTKSKIEILLQIWGAEQCTTSLYSFGAQLKIKYNTVCGKFGIKLSNNKNQKEKFQRENFNNFKSFKVIF